MNLRDFSGIYPISSVFRAIWAKLSPIWDHRTLSSRALLSNYWWNHCVLISVSSFSPLESASPKIFKIIDFDLDHQNLTPPPWKHLWWSRFQLVWPIAVLCPLHTSADELDWSLYCRSFFMQRLSCHFLSKKSFLEQFIVTLEINGFFTFCCMFTWNDQPIYLTAVAADTDEAGGATSVFWFWLNRSSKSRAWLANQGSTL